jgi:putative ABC transport system permease protein
MMHDLRFALRMIASHRWFSAAVVATLALGIGLNTMVFTLVDAALFKPIALPRGERLMAINNRDLAQGSRGMNVSYPDFGEYRAHASTLEALEAATQDQAVLSERDNAPQSFSMDRVSPGLFEMLRVPPILGRGFLPADGEAGAQPVVLLGYGVWKDRYGSSPGILGRVVRVNEKPATIIGVMPAGFKFPENESLWMVLQPTPDLADRTHHTLQLFGILRPGATIAQAGADLERIARRLAIEYPADKNVGALVQTFHQRYNGGNIQMVFLLMLAAVGFVLLIACANVANMMLSRALDRRREMSIRAAMGASRWQVVRQLLTESLLLSALGGVLGLALSTLGVNWFDAASQDVGKPYWVVFGMDYTVFGYFAALCVFSGLLFGLVPALQSSRVDLIGALKDGARTVGTHRGGRLSGALVVFQFALTLVLLTGAGVFVRGFFASQSINSWAPAGRLLTARVRLPHGLYPAPGARQRFFEQLLPRLEAIPGVTRAAIVSNPPGLGAGDRRIEIENRSVAEPAHLPSASVVVQSPGYFAAIDLPLLAGRDFNQTDGAPGRQSAVVSKGFAAHYWPQGDSVGKRFRFYTDDKPGEWIAVIGVSAGMNQQPGEAAPNPLLFLPYRQESYDSMALLVRTAGDPASATSAVRAAVQGLDRDLPLFDVRTLTDAIEHDQWYLRLFGKLFAAFALIALVMASVGIYAVIAQAAGSRTREIGVRMALGATSRSILNLVLTRGLKQLIAGLALGLAAAFPAARLLSNLPFLGVSASDPMVFAAVSLMLTAVGLFACWLPARKAAALNPVQAIRHE